jgi:alkylhydroperoxidase family enzyme
LQDPDPALHDCLARADLDGAPVPDAERALLRFVRLVTVSAYRTTDEDVEELRRHGWTDPQIAECVYVTALFAFFNRVADAFGLDDPGYFANPPAVTPGAAPPAPPRPDRGAGS